MKDSKGNSSNNNGYSSYTTGSGKAWSPGSTGTTGYTYKPCHTGNIPVLFVENGGTLFLGGWSRSATTAGLAVIDLTGSASIPSAKAEAMNPSAKQAFGRLLERTGPRKQPWLRLPVVDFQSPNLDIDDYVALASDVLDMMQNGTSVLIACTGGHGRTGTVAAVLLGLLGPKDIKENPVKWLRDNYCDEAIETEGQMQHVAKMLGLDRALFGEPAKHSYTTGTTGQGALPFPATGGTVQTQAGVGTAPANKREVIRDASGNVLCPECLKPWSPTPNMEGMECDDCFKSKKAFTQMDGLTKTETVTATCPACGKLWASTPELAGSICDSCYEAEHVLKGTSKGKAKHGKGKGKAKQSKYTCWACRETMDAADTMAVGAEDKDGKEFFIHICAKCDASLPTESFDYEMCSTPGCNATYPAFAMAKTGGKCAECFASGTRVADLALEN